MDKRLNLTLIFTFLGLIKIHLIVSNKPTRISRFIVIKP